MPTGRLRGRTGGFALASDVVSAIGQALAMMVGGGVAAGLNGISKAVVGRIAIYGYRAAQGYEAIRLGGLLGDAFHASGIAVVTGVIPTQARQGGDRAPAGESRTTSISLLLSLTPSPEGHRGNHPHAQAAGCETGIQQPTYNIYNFTHQI